MENYQLTKEEQKLFSSIEDAIHEKVSQKIIALNKNPSQKIDPKSIEEECKKEVLGELNKYIKSQNEQIDQFFAVLKNDDAKLHEELTHLRNKIKSKANQVKSYQEAKNELSMNLDEKTIKRLNDLGQSYYDRQDDEKAHLYFLFLSWMDGENFNHWLMRGFTEQNLKRYEDALMSYSVVIQNSPDILLTYVQVMQCFILLKQFEQAKQFLEMFKHEIDPASFAHDQLLTKKFQQIEQFFVHAA